MSGHNERALAKLLADQMDRRDSKDVNGRVRLAEVDTIDPMTIRPMGGLISIPADAMLWTNIAKATRDNWNVGDTVVLASQRGMYIVIDLLDVGEVLPVGGGGATGTLDELTDVAITAAATGDVLMKALAGWVNGKLTASNFHADNIDGVAGTASVRTLGTGAQQAAAGNHTHASLPSTQEKEALAGTNGSPSSANRYVTNSDPRNSDARTPLGHSHVIADTTGLQTALDARQPLDADLTAIAAIAPTDNDVIQRKAGAWINRTPAQLKADLALTKTDVGLGNVDNTSDANKPVSTAQAAADNLRVLKSGDTMTGALAVLNAHLGNWAGGATYAQFAHQAVAGNSGAYALIQSDTGITFLNSASGRIYFRVGNITQAELNAAGQMTVRSAPANSDHAVRKLELDAETTARTSADSALDGRLDTIEGDYTTSVELADAFEAQPVRYVKALHTANVLTTNPGTASFGGVTLAAGDRVLLYSQTTATEKGIWIFNGSAVAMTRPDDWAAGSVIPKGTEIVITDGTYIGHSWVGNQAITVGTTAPSWTRYMMSLTMGESVGGIKTFTAIPNLPSTDPTTDNQATRRAFVLAQDALKADLNHTHTLDALSDVDTTGAASGDVLAYNGASWIKTTPGAPGAHASTHEPGGTDVLSGLVPVGSITDFAGAAAPSGWLLCHGQLVSRTTYADLYSVIGDAYGAGDGTTTFALPDLRGRVTVGLDNMGGTDAGRIAAANTLGGTGGVEAVALAVSEIPSHSHVATVTDPGHNHGALTGARTVTFADVTTGGRNPFTTGITVTAAKADFSSTTTATVSDPGHTHATTDYARRTATTGGGSALAAGTQVWNFSGTIPGNTTGISVTITAAALETAQTAHGHATTAATLNTAGDLAHTHGVTGASLVAAQTAHDHSIPTGTTGITVSNAAEGGGAAHTNLQPYMLLNKIIHTGV